MITMSVTEKTWEEAVAATHAAAVAVDNGKIAAVLQGERREYTGDEKTRLFRGSVLIAGLLALGIEIEVTE